MSDHACQCFDCRMRRPMDAVENMRKLRQEAEHKATMEFLNDHLAQIHAAAERLLEPNGLHDGVVPGEPS